MPKTKLIRRRKFETSGFRTIELSRGIVQFPDATQCRFNVRLLADPGEEGGIRLVVEDINKPTGHSKSIKLTRKP
jgi:hypothetical protein